MNGVNSLKRLNKTEKNLQLIWKQLDDASGSLYNALDNLARMVDLSDDMRRQADMIDVTRIDGLKQEIEDLIEGKKKDTWHFEHDEFECDQCRTYKGSHKLNLYLGMNNGEDAQKYECSNKECDFVEIKTLTELAEN
jgi:hypothetical protein